ncbi:hypothetical protein [Arthrobacter russicus]|jgi:hypothetical protein|uniref:F0F1-type ATP synthase assembly protein I n=1 Tax=Arthrobacter russicus TaxID=172040 RepID=A0ABU1JFB5_9MICC|nr:hypothetical protein [Arthrobacter russicus]MBQ1442441.1 hypothetical protein [Renibacterium sp.]MDR6271129.1 F0F1-type ATP synthase assembly protein I [Arthrobacter russicus]
MKRNGAIGAGACLVLGVAIGLATNQLIWGIIIGLLVGAVVGGTTSRRKS